MPTTHPAHESTRLRAGIIGGGFIAGVHARSIRVAGAQVVGIASSSSARAERAAAEFRIARPYDSPARLIASDEIDVVHICTPNSTHAELATLAIEAGKHVVCEKPLTTSVAESARLAVAAQESGLVATIPFVYRFHPMAREMKARLASRGTRIYTVTGSYLQDWMSREADTDWRIDSVQGGASRAFGDIGSHLADLIEFVTNERISAVQASMRTIHPVRDGRAVDTEDLGVVLLEMSGGGVGTMTVSQVAQGRKNALTIEISAADESLRFDQENPEQLWIGRRTGSELLARDARDLSSDAVRLSVAPAGHPLGYLDAFAAFVADTYAAIGGDAPLGLPTFEDGLRSAIVVDAVIESARTSTSVRIEPFAVHR